MVNRPSLSAGEVLGTIDQRIRKEFETNRRVLSFEEYLLLVNESPIAQTRGSAQYSADMMDHFGREPNTITGFDRFKVFDLGVDGHAPSVVGQEQVQNQIYRAFKTFSRQKINNKLILLHGPNGSAKSSLIHALMAGFERYSQEPQGALYSFNWVFPVDKITKGGIGINTYKQTRDDVLSFARLADEDVASRIPCDLKDHPLLLIPAEQRLATLESLMGAAKAREVWEHMPVYLTQGGPCHRCKMISDALLTANNGDFRKVLMHVQVERVYYSRRYRSGLITIEPQMHVDAQFHQLTYNRSMAHLPASLQSLNLFALGGDLIEGNRGMIEFSDLLKRPVDTFKYLLTACETGSVNVGSSIAYLDTLLMGSTNEIQLDAFKEFPDFMSFKARIELIRVPYLLQVGAEKQIYEPQLKQMAGEKHIAPHVAWTTALWAVLTRLKKPNSINFPPQVSALVSNLTPLEKARFYDTGEMPGAMAPEDRKVLKSARARLLEEYSNVPYYEGRMGASAREMKSILFDAAQNSEFACLSPLAVLRQTEDFVKHVSEYEFLKQDVKDGYHNAVEFVNTVRNEYINLVDREVRDSIGLYDSVQWEEFLRRYVGQISLVLKKEKTKNAITGKMEDPDFTLIAEFEKIVEAPDDSAARDAFRQNIISQIGAWSLDHPKEQVVYARVFPDFWRKLEKHYFESQKALLTQMHDSITVYGTEDADQDSEGARLARKTVENMKARQGYCEHCAKEVITFLMKTRY